MGATGDLSRRLWSCKKRKKCHGQLGLPIRLVKPKREKPTTCQARKFLRKPETNTASRRRALERGEQGTRGCKEDCGRREQRNSAPGAETTLGRVCKCACADPRGGRGARGGAWWRSLSLRGPNGAVGEGGPCVSVLLFRGSGGGGKMAAHGGSAASSALKGLIQQFTAITGKRRGYRKVESGVWRGRQVCPGLPLTFLHSSLGLSPQLPSSLRRKRRRRRRVSGFRRRAASPSPHAPQTLVLGLLVV